jgi:hypothetical protein
MMVPPLGLWLHGPDPPYRLDRNSIVFQTESPTCENFLIALGMQVTKATGELHFNIVNCD